MLEENPVKKARTNNGGGSRRKKGEGTQAQAAAKTEKKTATKRTAASGAQKEAPKKRVSRKVTQDAAPAPAILTEDRHRMIAEAAYFIAERRGFQGGNPEQDWFEAEKQISRMLESSAR